MDARAIGPERRITPSANPPMGRPRSGWPGLRGAAAKAKVAAQAGRAFAIRGLWYVPPIMGRYYPLGNTSNLGGSLIGRPYTAQHQSSDVVDEGPVAREYIVIKSEHLGADGADVNAFNIREKDRTAVEDIAGTRLTRRAPRYDQGFVVRRGI
jgi:hypothetical protein